MPATAGVGPRRDIAVTMWCGWSKVARRAALATLFIAAPSSEAAKSCDDALAQAQQRIFELEADLAITRSRLSTVVTQLESQLGNFSAWLAAREAQIQGVIGTNSSQEDALGVRPPRSQKENAVEAAGATAAVPPAIATPAVSGTSASPSQPLNVTKFSALQGTVEGRILALAEDSERKHKQRQAVLATLLTSHERSTADLLAKVRHLEEMLSIDPGLVQFLGQPPNGEPSDYSSVASFSAAIAAASLYVQSFVTRMSRTFAMPKWWPSMDAVKMAVASCGPAVERVASALQRAAEEGAGMFDRTSVALQVGLSPVCMVVVLLLFRVMRQLLRKVLWAILMLITGPPRLLLKVGRAVCRAPANCCRRIFQRRGDVEGKVTRADLGEKSAFYYDAEKKKWRERGKEHLEEEDRPLAPPPAMGSSTRQGSDDTGPKKELSALDVLMAPPAPRNVPAAGNRPSAMAPRPPNPAFGAVTPPLSRDASRSPRFQTCAFGTPVNQDASRSPRIRTSAFGALSTAPSAPDASSSADAGAYSLPDVSRLDSSVSSSPQDAGTSVGVAPAVSNAAEPPQSQVDAADRVRPLSPVSDHLDC